MQSRSDGLGDVFEWLQGKSSRIVGVGRHSSGCKVDQVNFVMYVKTGYFIAIVNKQLHNK